MKPNNIVYMKYGIHASESVDDIIQRKQKEFSDGGMSFWGYGGTLCHPLNQVQVFAEEIMRKGEKLYLLMSRTPSNLWNEATLSESYSTNKENWLSIPTHIKVSGSKYALVISELKPCDFMLNLNDYKLPVGAQTGKKLGEYIGGRVDKGCGVLCLSEKEEEKNAHITLMAEIVTPYAVFLQ